MRLIALTICRNSAWSIEAVAGHALTYCDHLVALCHACTDGTEDILRGLGDKVTVVTEKGNDWKEMNNRQRTLETGRALGGSHFLILDDDEILTANMVPGIRKLALQLEEGMIWQMPMYNCWRSLDQVRCDPGSPFAITWKSTIFRDSPDLHWESRKGYQHHHTHPYGSNASRWYPKDGGWLHFQHAYWPRLVVKQCWYMAMELCRYGKIRANYLGTLNEKGLETRLVPQGWWPDVKDKINLEAVPWQLGELRQMVEDRGPEFFERHRIQVRKIFEHWDNIQPV